MNECGLLTPGLVRLVVMLSLLFALLACQRAWPWRAIAAATPPTLPALLRLPLVGDARPSTSEY